jgi:GNAT superfamily N-acetyltransferase
VVIRGDATEQASIRRVADRIFARPTTDQNLASLAGAPDSVTVRIVRVGQSEKLNAYMETPHWYSGSTFRKSATGPVIELDTIEVMQGQQGKGIARKIVGRMIESASEHGVSRITMEAASGAENVGYKVWPRMGFDGPIPASQKTVLPASLHGSERVSDLYATSAGREWWAAHGGDVHLEFDLSPGSKSWRMWISYLNSKK